MLEQIPAENLPSQFGGNCRCGGGCELSDEGPWQDPQWLGPQAKSDTAITGKKEKGSSSFTTTPTITTTATSSTFDSALDPPPEWQDNKTLTAQT